MTQVYIQQANNDVFTQSSEHSSKHTHTHTHTHTHHTHTPCTHTVVNTHSSEHTHTTHTHTVVNTHTHTWSSRGFVALLKGLTSVVDNFCRSRDSSPQPQVTSLTLYPLEPRLPPTPTPYNVLLSIATNIAVLLMTASVLQGHICCKIHQS